MKIGFSVVQGAIVRYIRLTNSPFRSLSSLSKGISQVWKLEKELPLLIRSSGPIGNLTSNRQGVNSG